MNGKKGTDEINNKLYNFAVFYECVFNKIKHISECDEDKKPCISGTRGISIDITVFLLTPRKMDINYSKAYTFKLYKQCSKC